MFRRLLSTIFRVTVFASVLALPPRMATAPADSESAAHQTLTGKQLTYRVRYRAEGYTELSNAIGAASQSEAPNRHNLLASLEATEILTFLDRDHGLVRASVRFERPVIRIQVDAKSQPKQEGEIAQCLGYSAVLYFDAQSKVTRSEFPREYSTMAGN